MDGALRNDRALPKIAALLVALALIAERAAGRSFPVRFIVLGGVRRIRTRLHKGSDAVP